MQGQPKPTEIAGVYAWTPGESYTGSSQILDTSAEYFDHKSAEKASKRLEKALPDVFQSLSLIFFI